MEKPSSKGFFFGDFDAMFNKLRRIIIQQFIDVDAAVI
jgi:hypothetical protein